jgi:hypothetical protein
MSYGLQAEAGGSAVRGNASADLTGWLVLHFTFEPADFLYHENLTFERLISFSYAELPPKTVCIVHISARLYESMSYGCQKG